MTWLRTIRVVVRPLLAVFLLAQLAGVVPSPRLDAALTAGLPGSHGHHHDGFGHGGGGAAHHDGDRDRGGVDPCCALHAFFAAILPPAIVMDTVAVGGKQLGAGTAQGGVGVPPGRLDRPPRPPALI
jgi:hypothetical protein